VFLLMGVSFSRLINSFRSYTRLRNFILITRYVHTFLESQSHRRRDALSAIEGCIVHGPTHDSRLDVVVRYVRTVRERCTRWSEKDPPRSSSPTSSPSSPRVSAGVNDCVTPLSRILNAEFVHDNVVKRLKAAERGVERARRELETARAREADGRNEASPPNGIDVYEEGLASCIRDYEQVILEEREEKMRRDSTILSNLRESAKALVGHFSRYYEMTVAALDESLPIEEPQEQGEEWDPTTKIPSSSISRAKLRISSWEQCVLRETRRVFSVAEDANAWAHSVSRHKENPSQVQEFARRWVEAGNRISIEPDLRNDVENVRGLLSDTEEEIKSQNIRIATAATVQDQVDRMKERRKKASAKPNWSFVQTEFDRELAVIQRRLDDAVSARRLGATALLHCHHNNLRNVVVLLFKSMSRLHNTILRSYIQEIDLIVDELFPACTRDVLDADSDDTIEERIDGEVDGGEEEGVSDAESISEESKQHPHCDGNGDGGKGGSSDEDEDGDEEPDIEQSSHDDISEGEENVHGDDDVGSIDGGSVDMENDEHVHA
jgi:hypothetical protein